MNPLPLETFVTAPTPPPTAVSRWICALGLVQSVLCAVGLTLHLL